jgi:tetratricopeptide (TPR) repeat protein
MASTARRVKKSIKEDQLVTTTFRLTEWAQEHFNQVIIGVVALVAIVAVLVFASNSRDANAHQAQQQMGSALAQYAQNDFTNAKASFQQIYERYGGKQGVVARFFAAECDYRAGSYQQAIDGYDAYLAQRKDYPLFEASALIGKGMCYEALRNFPQAAQSLADALKVLDAKDPRYLTTAFDAGDFYLKANNPGEARKYYDMVVKDASGDLKSRAEVAMSMLK